MGQLCLNWINGEQRDSLVSLGLRINYRFESERYYLVQMYASYAPNLTAEYFQLIVEKDNSSLVIIHPD
jgi:hypothetical protein